MLQKVFSEPAIKKTIAYYCIKCSKKVEKVLNTPSAPDDQSNLINELLFRNRRLPVRDLIEVVGIFAATCI